MYTPDRQINPDSVYEREEDTELFCVCGCKLFENEEMCDDCLCELEDPQN